MLRPIQTSGWPLCTAVPVSCRTHQFRAHPYIFACMLAKAFPDLPNSSLLIPARCNVHYCPAPSDAIPRVARFAFARSVHDIPFLTTLLTCLRAAYETVLLALLMPCPALGSYLPTYLRTNPRMACSKVRATPHNLPKHVALQQLALFGSST